jgi:hypothetical protein
MKYITLFTISTLSLLLFACTQSVQKESDSMHPSKVEIKGRDGNYSLYVNGKPFFVEGAGVDDGDIAALASRGANALRTWNDSEVYLPEDHVLNKAKENGLMVLMGLPMGKERHGFDYSDEKAVREQFEMIRQKVLEMKDHPALLGWGIGNELNLKSTNMKVWDAVEEIAAFIHKVDGNHPVTTMLAGIGKEEVDYISKNCPNLDFLSIQIYGAIENLPDFIREAGYSGPYLITEWGATGHWEVPHTSWNAPIENTSTEKARNFKYRYETVILADSTNCLGSFVFLWGQKQERTPTWYGLFTEAGNSTEAVDVMQYLWTGQWPENRAPFIHELTLDGKKSIDNIFLAPGQEVDINYRFEDADGDSLKIRIEILKESTDLKEGGDMEERPESLKVEILSLNDTGATIVSPSEPGAYRVFIYGSDHQSHAATGNVPFMVQKE